MTEKLYLPARPANEGARLFVRWILREHRGDLNSAAWSLGGCSSAMAERLVTGAVLPGEALAEPLARRAGVDPRAWRRPAAGGWFDAELARAA